MQTPEPTFNHSAHTVSLEIDLNELFEGEVSDTLAASIGTAIRDEIVKLAESGKSAKGYSFKSYDDDYVESEEFQAAGKSKSDVNMTLYGDMLASLEVININSGRIELGWDETLEQKKAYAHMTGFRGHPTIKNGPKREFLAVNQKLLENVKSRFRDRVSEGFQRPGASEVLALLNQVRTQQEEQNLGQIFFNPFGGSDDSL